MQENDRAVCMLGISIMPLSMIFIGYWNCSASTTRQISV